MGQTLEADWNDSSFPLILQVDFPGLGGVDGIAATVAVRLSPTTDQYLDWNTMTFKNAGWGLRDMPMTDISNGVSLGVYQVILNVQALGFTPKTGLPQKLFAQYATPQGQTATGIATGGNDCDTIFVTELRPDAKLGRQYQTNRLETIGGSPNGTHTLYGDDGVTVQSVQQLNDFSGGAVGNGPGWPSKRGSVP